MNDIKYRIHIEWSEEDNSFLVALPDFPGQKWSTHGETYEEALLNAKEVIELLIETYQTEGKPLPKPQMAII
jgi:predicted RNase H-like HicB family nuclease